MPDTLLCDHPRERCRSQAKNLQKARKAAVEAVVGPEEITETANEKTLIEGETPVLQPSHEVRHLFECYWWWVIAEGVQLP